MANQRLNQLMKKTEVQYTEGSPLLLEACALYFDTETSNCIAQMKWKNIDQKPIKAVMIELDCYDAFEQKLDPINYQYDGLLVTQGSDFGSKTPIIIPTNKAVKCDVLLKAVSFSDETVWRADQLSPFASLPESKKQSLEGELLDQFKRDLSQKGIKVASSFDPQTYHGLWQCGCGSWQYSDTPCLKCKTTKKALEDASDESVLAKHLLVYKEEQERLRIEAERKAEEDRIAREKEEAERRAQEEEEQRIQEELRKEQEAIDLAFKKKKKKIILVTSIVIALIVAGGLATNFYFIPKGKYDNAVKMMEAGQYQDAYNAFSALGDFSDSGIRMRQVEANYYYSIGAYDNVGDIYATLPEKYQDHASDFVSQYNDAKAQMEEGKYDEAITAFTKLGNYSDSKELITEATYRKAGHYAEQGLYDEAIAIYTNLGEYSDSTNLLTQAKADKLYASGDYTGALKIYATLDQKYHTNAKGYEKLYSDALALQNEGKYDEAVSAFTAIADYSDSSTQIMQSKYLKANALATSGNYQDAITLFDGLGDYSDSKSLSKKASADKLYDAKDYSSAYSIYATLGEAYQTHAADYTSMYNSAKALLDAGNYDGAASAFAALGSYSDSPIQINECNYQKAASLTAKGEYDAAITIYNSLNEYKDSKSLAAQANADKLYMAGSFADAYDIYATLGEKYQTHESDYNSKYTDAKALQTAGEYDQAVTAFSVLGKYSDSSEQIKQTKYLKAGSLATSGKYDDAIALYGELGEYSDSKSLALKANADKLFASGDASKAYDIYATLDEAYQTHAADYASAYQAAEAARTAGDYDNAYDQFIALGNYSDAKEKAIQCGNDKADGLFASENYGEAATVYSFIGDSEKAKLSTYKFACQLVSDGQYTQAAEQFSSIIDYEDSREQRYQTGLKAFEAGQLADAYGILVSDIDYNNAKETIYQIGVSASAAQQYEISVKAFTAVGTYKDSAMNLTMDTYAYGEQLHDAGRYDEAAAVFTGMNGFSNTAEKAQMSAYAAAVRELENGNFENAVKRFTALGKYSDSETQVKEANFQWAESLFASGDYETAKTMFAALGKYSTSEERLKATKYAIAQKHYEAAEYDDAVSGFHEISGYNDADERELASRYALYGTYYSAGMYDEAIAGFELIAGSNYSDSATQAKKSHYAKAQALDASDRTAAYYEYVLAVDYSDAQQQVKIHAYEIALSLQESNAYNDAVGWYEIASDYSNAQEQLYKIGSFYFSTQDYEMSLNAFKTLRDYKDSSDYLLRIGNYFEMQSDTSNAYLAYGYASHQGENTEKINGLKQILSENAEKALSSGKIEDANVTYETLSKIDPSFGENLNAVEFISFLEDCKTITIGNTKWKYLAYENGKLIFISNTSLTKAPYYSYKGTTVEKWLSSAKGQYFNSEEGKLVTLWIMSSSEAKKYMKSNSDRKTSGAEYIWCSDKDSSGWSTVYKYYNASTGEFPSYFYSSTGGESKQNGVRPGMKMTYNTSVYQLLTADTSRYSFQGQDGKDVVFEPKFQSVGTSQKVEDKPHEKETTDASKGTDMPSPNQEKNLSLKPSYAEYVAAELDSEVIVETYVQATQSWWDNKIVVYAQSPDGAYFIYNMACSEADAAKLVPGTPIRVSGYKGEWAGEVEIVDATFEFLEAEPYIATPRDVTDLLGKNELESHQNELVSFKGMTVVAQENGNAFSYKNAAEKTDDLYYTVSKDGKTYDFCVEFYLYGPDTEVYKSVENLQVGDIIDIDAFLYWYNGPNPHSVKVTKTSKATNDTSSTESSDETRNVNGWYVSNDGKYAIKPSNLRKSYNGYLVSIQIREEASKSIILDDSVTITPEDSIPSLIPDKAIQEFIHEGNGKYSFKIACDIKLTDSAYANVTGITFTQGFSFTVN